MSRQHFAPLAKVEPLPEDPDPSLHPAESGFFPVPSAITAVQYTTAAAVMLPTTLGRLPEMRALDLHHYNQYEALLAVEEFLDDARNWSYGIPMTVEIITGRGLHSTNGQPVLHGVVRERLQLLQSQGKIRSFRAINTSGAFAVFL